MKHEQEANITGGRGMESWIQPRCSCGWEGSRHWAHNDYQYTNAIKQWQRHVMTVEPAQDPTP